jgi:exodeoxyribonuclease VII small subunit
LLLIEAMQDIPKDIENMSFEQAMSELEKIVRGLETGEITLSDSIANYLRGNALKLHCQKILDSAKLQVERIIKLENGEVQTEPFEA